ncbi:MAG TPA: DapH/DapD/GlmU-related protein [Candidatus Aminicenantes bacterium]|nr:DapH/DapD/GlmU-related protein [Candidatus Aminicenantes bacterium]
MKRKTVVLFTGEEERTDFAPVLGRPLGAYALEAACGVGPEAVLVLPGPGAGPAGGWEALIGSAGTKTPVFLLENGGRRPAKRRNALDALATARPILEDYPGGDLLIVPSSLPLLRGRTLRALLRAHAAKGFSLTFLSGGGSGGLTGVLALRTADVFPLLRASAAKTGGPGFGGVARRLTEAGRRVGYVGAADPGEALAVGGAADVARAARALRDRKNDGLARRGVVLLDPASAWIDWAASVGPRTVIHPFVVVEGPSAIGPDARIHPHVHIVRSTVGARAQVLSSTVMEDTVLEADVQVGPFSRFRPKTRVCAGAKVGNFVEMKNTVFGPRSKAQHLSYVGDSRVAEDVNVGAGTITCNYDGSTKNPTRIGAGAFIGSGTELVAPVTVGRGAYVAAGSTITEDVSAGALAIARARQVEKPGWARERAKDRKRRGGGHGP